jgi:hypothetical protein
MLSLEEAAVRVNRSSSILRRYCREARVPATKVGKTWVLFSEDIELFEAKLKAMKPGRPKG